MVKQQITFRLHVLLQCLRNQPRDNDNYHNVFHLREDRTGIPLIDDIELHFLELPKLDEHAVPVKS